MPRPTCGECSFWCPSEAEEFLGKGECRRKSPGTDGMVPVTTFDYWCGEHSEWYRYIMGRSDERVKEGIETCPPSASSEAPGTTA